MKITKYPQSNFVIEKSGETLLIDIGNFTLEKYNLNELSTPKAVLITHKHPDHMDVAALKALSVKEIPIYGNNDVAEKLSTHDIKVNRTHNQKDFEAAGFKITPIDIPHCKLLFCKEESKVLTANQIVSDKKVCKNHLDALPEKIDGPPNIGFLIDGLFFHPGDGIDPQSFEVENAAIPINGPSIEFKDAWKLVVSLNAKRVIPMHYTHPTFQTDPNKFAEEKPEDVQVVILPDGEFTTI